jgi:3'-phosphoadenosine 5'-phosphosulfate sulfotransferase (PAPS reductase)/FAD synthetase
MSRRRKGKKHLTEAISKTDRRPNTARLLALSQYRKVIVMFSGGKDSLACLLYLLLLGVPKEKIEIWHQCVDGAPGTVDGLMDWPVTESYVRAIGAALGVTVRFQWKHGGFEREMLRQNELTQPVTFEIGDGRTLTAGGKSGKPSTRQMFPQKSADLSVRWCSAYLKIDTAALALRNHPDFKSGHILVVSGERREESAARSKYAEVELLAKASNNDRIVHQWRAVIDWSESDVWAIIEAFKVAPSPVYQLGWGRKSCMLCIFGDKDQWATALEIAPRRVERVAEYERRFGKTIDRSLTVLQQAAKGTPYTYTEAQKRAALSRFFDPSQVFVDVWQMPSGAFKQCGGSI